MKTLRELDSFSSTPSGSELFVLHDAALVKDTNITLNAVRNILSPAMSEIYVDSGRTDTYTATGSVLCPYKTLSAAVAAWTAMAKPAVLHLAPGTAYTEASGVTTPNYKGMIDGKGATITITGSLTFGNASMIVDSVNVTTSTGIVTAAYASGSYVDIAKSTINGNITINGDANVNNSHMLSGTVTVGTSATVNIASCTGTSTYAGTGILHIQNTNISGSSGTAMIGSTAGQLHVNDCTIVNAGTGACISCDNGAVAGAPNRIRDSYISAASGAPVACGTAVTVYSRNHIYGTNTGTGYISANSDPTVTIAQGGTGATTAATARTALGAASTDVVSSSANGLCPLYPNNTTTYLRGDGTWATVSGSGSISAALLNCQTNAVITLTSGGWRTVPIGQVGGTTYQTVKTDSTSMVTIDASNQFALGAGTYRISLTMSCGQGNSGQSIGLVVGGTTKCLMSSRPMSNSAGCIHTSATTIEVLAGATNLSVVLYPNAAATVLPAPSGALTELQDGYGASSGYKPYMQILIEKIA